MLGRITIDGVRPATPCHRFPAKAVVGESVRVSATIFQDGHHLLAARVRWRPTGSGAGTATAAEARGGDTGPGGASGLGATTGPGGASGSGTTTGAGPGTGADLGTGVGGWQVAPLRDLATGTDDWAGEFSPSAVGHHEFVVEAWRDRFATWRHDVEVKAAVGDDVEVELEEGARILESLAEHLGPDDRKRALAAVEGLRRTGCSMQVRLNAGLDDRVAELVAPIPDADLTVAGPFALWVDRPRAGHGAWYELFPRSEGGFAGAAERLPAIAEMGFDVVYLPPIHPIGVTARKGPNNTTVAGPDDPGSPWAIGGAEGGHTAIDPGLGTLEDFRRFCAEAAERGMEVALDYALQCSPDHPWARDHPEWFWRRPDGSVRYAENPPKKYQDIYPLNFWPERDADRRALWDACRDVLLYWVSQGVHTFRVDNPHTKPMAFWAWLIEEVHRSHPEVVFLAEAFTRPPVMAKLAEVGFTQSYTYFTWRTGPEELRAYVEELAHGPSADYMRPNFWPNTPDILSGPLRNGSPAVFLVRYVLAATLVPSYGVYSGYELYENQPAGDLDEEYLDSEKYQLRPRDWGRADSMAPFVAAVNGIRRRHPAFRWLRNIRFHHSANNRILAYSKGHAAEGDLVLVVVNVDPDAMQETVLHLDVDAMGIGRAGAYEAIDELTGERYVWDGPDPYVRLDPTRGQVAHILALRG